MAATNTGSTSSSMTSTSHTMTALPPQPGPMGAASSESSIKLDLLAALSPVNRYAFIAPPPALPAASVSYAKAMLDPLAGILGEEYAERLKEQRREKRKRSGGNTVPDHGLKIRKIHTDGFEVEQVWEQAKRVIDALREDAERSLEELDGGKDYSEDEDAQANGDGVGVMASDESDIELGSGEDSMEDEEEDMEDMENLEGGDAADDDELIDEMEDEDEFVDENRSDEEAAAAGIFIQDPNGLNDGFFSIDDFNKQTEFLERQDAAADPYTGEASDEEDIDWDLNPMSIPTKLVPSSRRTAAMEVDESEEDSEDDDDGPTFGNADLNAPEGESDGEEDMDEATDSAIDNTNDILYKEFFEPPPRKAGKGEREANFLERQSRKLKAAGAQDDQAQIERAMAGVRRDLFEEESDQENSEDALSEVDPADPKSRRSTHERRQAKLVEEIRRLEAASVAKREWTLAGEARAVDRPKDSLLDEDLDFETTGKPVPIITAEISESIEDLVKRRILAQEFDEVIRRRPDSLSNPGNNRRGAFQLDDTKPQQSLAEMYEEEYVKNNNPDTYISKSEEKLRKEEKEIEILFKNVTATLDALSSWHFKPKPAAPSLTVVSDVATIAMEDAQPTTASGINGGASMLAPQEIYKAGQNKEDVEKGEIVRKSGAPVAREEMTREEKLRRRRREKERIKKRGGVGAEQRPENESKKRNKEVVGELKKGGVKVIGKKGDIRDVEGNKVQAVAAPSGAGGFKL